ncbi:abortive infection family protein [Burkholderia gladioli]|uniref:abortive infection family protein n=1 Tax=Burkholderia gladioli TaxID=28095 RepID=UPI001CF155E7|nr:abortive infection family protein [Burkholderia gladioli]MCA8171413.1 abortive infection family protein [Burkholderia gladioli]
MRDQIKAIVAAKKRVTGKETSVTEIARELTAALQEECAGLDVFGVSKVVVVDQPSAGDPHRLGAFLQFGRGRLVVMWNPRGTIQTDRLAGQWWRGNFSAAVLEKCPLSWLQQLLTKPVIDSLLDSIRGDVDERESRVNATLAEARLLLSAESAVLDAEMAESLTTTGDENLTGLWQDAVEATHNDTADALTRCSRFLEAVCAKILRERGVELPDEKSMGPLVKACQKSLDWPDSRELKGDVEQLLSGIRSICGGIGALRTHFGTAHGASSHLPPLDPAYAVFVKQATVAVATFLLTRHQASPPTTRADDASAPPSDPSPTPTP